MSKTKLLPSEKFQTTTSVRRCLKARSFTSATGPPDDVKSVMGGGKVRSMHFKRKMKDLAVFHQQAEKLP